MKSSIKPQRILYRVTNFLAFNHGVSKSMCESLTVEASYLKSDYHVSKDFCQVFLGLFRKNTNICLVSVSRTYFLEKRWSVTVCEVLY